MSGSHRSPQDSLLMRWMAMTCRTHFSHQDNPSSWILFISWASSCVKDDCYMGHTHHSLQDKLESIVCSMFTVPNVFGAWQHVICLWYLILTWQTFMIPHQRWPGSVSLHQCNTEGICGCFHVWGCITASAYLCPMLFPEWGSPFHTSGTHKKDGGCFQGGCFHIASNMGYCYIWSGEGANVGWIT